MVITVNNKMTRIESTYQINMNIKNPQLWLKDTFSTLNAFAIRKENNENNFEELLQKTKRKGSEVKIQIEKKSNFKRSYNDRSKLVNTNIAISKPFPSVLNFYKNVPIFYNN